MSNKSAMEERLIAKFNATLGSDFKELHKSKYLVEGFKQDYVDIQNKLSLESGSNSEVKKIIDNSVVISEKLETKCKNIKQFQKKLSKHLGSFESTFTGISETVSKIRHLEHFIEYLKILQDIQDISNGLKNSINSRDESKLVGLYLSLCGEPNSMNSVIGRLSNVEAYYIKSFAERTAIYWHEVLEDKFSRDFRLALKAAKWPNLSQNLDDFKPSKDTMNKLSSLAEYLFLIRPPGDNSDEYTLINSTILCPPISTVTELLLIPFRQKFMFHFTGIRQTNRLDKPEWFFTQILLWARQNHIFVAQTFQLPAIHAGHENFNVRLEFIRGLVQLAIEKLCIDMEDIIQDELLFAHLLDETLSFEHELRETLGYPSNYTSVISVLTQPQYLMRWLSVEEKFSADKMDAMLTTGNPWQYIDPSNSELKITICADHFVRLLDAIRERYCCLPQPGHQLQFLNLQLELIEDFRRRLVQLHNSAETNVPTTKVLNTINYVISVLSEWGENVHYLHLHAALLGPDAEEINSVFETPVAELEHWRQKLIKTLVTKVYDDIRSKTMAYRHDNWVTMPDSTKKEPQILSSTAGEMFQRMVSNLHNFEVDLSENMFNTVLRMLAKNLDDFFIDSMIMNTKFSPGGAAQFQYDMTRMLFSLFGQYTRRAELLFKKIQNACSLLNLPTGSALLLHEEMRQEKNADKKLKILKEVGISGINVFLAMDILERRTDICA